MTNLAGEYKAKPTMEQYIVQGTCDYIIVHADSRFENSLQITGEDGKVINLVVDGEYESDKKRCWGTAVALPKKISGDRVMFSDSGKPVRQNEIVPDVNQFEKVYFSYLALTDSMEILPNHYAIPYSDIIATIRNGEIIPVGSNVLLKPVYPSDCIEIDKGVYGRTNSFGMVVEMNVKPKPNEAIVYHTGRPLRNREDFLLVGQHVGLDKWAYGQYYDIEGESYLVARQHEIAWVYQD